MEPMCIKKEKLKCFCRMILHKPRFEGQIQHFEGFDGQVIIENRANSAYNMRLSAPWGPCVQRVFRMILQKRMFGGEIHHFEGHM